MLTRTEVIDTYSFRVWCLLVCANVCDAKYYRVPNELIGLGYLLGIHIHVMSYGAKGLVIFMVKAVIPILLLYLLYVIDGLGAGDIKLYSVITGCTSAVVGTMESLLLLVTLSIFIAGAAIVLRCFKEKRLDRRKLHFSFYITAAFYTMQWL